MQPDLISMISPVLYPLKLTRTVAAFPWRRYPMKAPCNCNEAFDHH